MVKEAFNDVDLNAKFRLTSANSINIARLIPQTFYYFYAYAQALKAGKKNIVFSVPSGNFGNIGAGLLAYIMGLPAKLFIAATNVNDTVPLFMQNGVYSPKPSVQTLSNAMDVGDPSNWVRIMDLFGNEPAKLKEVVQSCSFDDTKTMEGIHELYSQYNYIACPHTAVAYLAAKEKIQPDHYTIFLSTSPSCKFIDVYSEELKSKIEIPEQVQNLLTKKQQSTPLENNFLEFKNFLLNRSF